MYIKVWKRFFDLLLSVIGIVLLLVPMLVVSILVKLDSNGSMLFRQTRSGRGRRPFHILKIRTMSMDTPKFVATNCLRNVDGRSTKIQRFLRKSSIDELPQLVNILMGDMSFIGPRPVICQETDLLDEREKYNANSVRPGLTGWAQINGRDNLDFREKAKLDGEYIQKMGLWFDMKCFLLTIKSVFRHEGFNDNVEQ